MEGDDKETFAPAERGVLVGFRGVGKVEFGDLAVAGDGLFGPGQKFLRLGLLAQPVVNNREPREAKGPLCLLAPTVGILVVIMVALVTDDAALLQQMIFH